mgnify:FL=1
MTAALLLTGGPDHAHDFNASGSALADVIAAAGFDVVIEHDPDRAAAKLTQGFRVLVVNALRWRMFGDRYDPWRPEWGYTTPESTRRSLAAFVAEGGGLVGVHTASICFDDWPEWGDILGGAWEWGVSSHPPVGAVSARVAEGSTGHDVLGVAPVALSLNDEVYGDMSMRPGVQVLMVAKRTPTDDDQPVVWAHRYGSGRVVYDGFGHDAESIRNDAHAALLQRAVQWVSEEEHATG